MASRSKEHTGAGIALGLERLGLLSLLSPAVIAVVAILISVAAVFGVMRIKVDDSLSQLFRSGSAEFKQYEEVSRRFPSAEYDVLVVVEGDIMQRDSLEALRNVAIDLQLIDGTRSLISLFSARQPPVDGGIPEPLFPEELPTDQAAYKALVDRALNNDIIRGKLLSEDGKLALMVLALDPSVVDSASLNDVVGEVRQTVDDDLAGTPFPGRLAGVPVMQLEIRNAVQRDRIIYNLIGFLAGCVIAVIFFRRISFMIIAAAPPLVAMLWALGTLGWLDFRLNMFLNVMTPLIMVMAFSDSMQLTFAYRDRLLARHGEVRGDARRAHGRRSGAGADLARRRAARSSPC